jgi:hypothetical protein
LETRFLTARSARHQAAIDRLTAFIPIRGRAFNKYRIADDLTARPVFRRLLAGRLRIKKADQFGIARRSRREPAMGGVSSLAGASGRRTQKRNRHCHAPSALPRAMIQSSEKRHVFPNRQDWLKDQRLDPARILSYAQLVSQDSI